MAEQAVEFDCVDCGRHVWSVGYDAQIARCNSCDWIRQHIPPEEQAEVRERLGVPLSLSSVMPIWREK